MSVGSVLLALRQRTRDYDGQGVRDNLPGVQIAFLVSPLEVDLCYCPVKRKLMDSCRTD